MVGVVGMRKSFLAGILVVVLVAGVAVGLVYWKGHSSGCRGFKITDLCATTSVIFMNTTGDCDTARAVIVDSSGVERASFTFRVGGRVAVNLTPNLPPGPYTLKILVDGRVVDEASIRVYEAPFIEHARALILPNGSITVTFLPHSPPCMKHYGVSAVIVLVNGTKHTFTGHWEKGQDIRINLGKTINPKTQIIVIVVDTLGRYYRAGIAMPI